MLKGRNLVRSGIKIGIQLNLRLVARVNSELNVGVVCNVYKMKRSEML